MVMTLGLSASLYACGSDADDPSGAAGTAGSMGGKGGNGGSSAKAGSGGSGGSGAKAGTGGEISNVGGDSGSGGDNGSGGAAGDMGSAGDSGNAAGAGGEGGAAANEQTLAEACASVCVPAHALAACSTEVDACVTQCTGYPGVVQAQVTDGFVDADFAVTLNDEYLALLRCLSTKVTSTDQFVCAADPLGLTAPWSPKADTACETVLCKWSTDDGNMGTMGADPDVYTRCNP